MIGKGKSIAHTRASMSYGWNNEKDAEVVFRQNLAGENPEQLTEEFKMVQEQNTRCQKNTLSFVLSPTPEDGKNLSERQLNEITNSFVKKMQLSEHQAIGFVHRNKAPTHIHLYVNRIGFDGKAYNDCFIGKYSQLAAEKVAKEMGITTARDVKLKKILETKTHRVEIKSIHDKVMDNQKPRTLDEYVKAIKNKEVKVIPSINKANKLQGFRFEYQGHNFKGSEVHRSMSGGKLIQQLSFSKNLTKPLEADKSVKLMGKTLEMSTSLATSVAKNLLKKTIKKALEVGIGY